jgi:translation elongation factor EF-Tu-like GTPase
MRRPRDIEVEIRFLSIEEGGRQGPARSGYRPQFYYDGQDWDAVHEYIDREWVHPGETVMAYLALMSPQHHVGKLVPGTKFQLREGTRVVGEGVVTRTLELEESAKRVRT